MVSCMQVAAPLSPGIFLSSHGGIKSCLGQRCTKVGSPKERPSYDERETVSFNLKLQPCLLAEELLEICFCFQSRENLCMLFLFGHVQTDLDMSSEVVSHHPKFQPLEFGIPAAAPPRPYPMHTTWQRGA